jgi:4-amino-4-deoxy-L-arabinose transferase-like glycosyltransferase
MSETVVIVTVLLCVWLAYRFWDDPTPGNVVLLGVAVGLGTLARSELLLLGPLLILPLVLLVRRRSWRWRIGWVAASAAAVVAVLSPWLVYNNLRFDETVFISQNLGGTLAVSYCETTYDGPLLGYWDYNCGIRAMAEAGLGDLGDPRNDPAMRDAGLEHLRENLSSLPKVVLAREGRILGLYEPVQQRNLDQLFEFMTPEVATAGMITLPFVLVGSVAGAVVLRRRRVLVLPLLAPIACVLLTVALFYAATRFRATAEASFCILTAVAVVALWDLVARRVRGRGGGRPAPSAGPRAPAGP